MKADPIPGPITGPIPGPIPGPAHRPPRAARDDTLDILHGVPIADPYRYLEDSESDRTRDFVQAQNAVSGPYLAALPLRKEFGRLTTALLTAPRAGVPWERGGHYFRIANPGDLDQDQLVTASSLPQLLQSPRLLLDPNLLASSTNIVDGTVALTAVSVSPDGRFVAYALSEAGSDWRTIGVRRVADGIDLPDRLPWTKWVDPVWLPDGGGFLYWRYPQPADIAATDAMGAGELALHQLGDPAEMDEVVWSRPADRDWMASPWVAPDGRWLILTMSPGTDSRATIQAQRLARDDTGRYRVGTDIVDVVADLADAHHVVGSVGDALFVRTERDAPRGRLVAVDLGHPENPWGELIGQHEVDVLVDAALADGVFAIIWSADAAHPVQITDRDGRHQWWPQTPSPVSVTAVQTRQDSTEIFFGTTSFTSPTRSWRIDPADDHSVSALPATASGIAVPAFTTVRRHAGAADGVAVPMTIVRRTDLPPGPRPTLLYGYGGFDIPVLPAFSAMFTAWVAAGGVLAVANLRGGGEFGARWHEAGMLHHKQTVFDDAIACARDLIDTGVTTGGQLAIHGRSNGGLLVGAAMTQHPELFAAALPVVGVLDMLRFHLFTIGWAWTSEYGSPEDPADFAVLLGYSPLHRLKPGTQYPSTLICTGDHDDRVVPAHSLKFGAELQYCQSGPGPVLLRVDTRAGHGMGKPVTALAAEYADQLAFVAAHTGLRVSAESSRPAEG